MKSLRVIIAILLLLTGAAFADADKRDYLELARKGWNYELRSTMLGRDMSIPVSIHGKALSGAALCLVGEAPHPISRETLEGFSALVAHIFAKPLPMRHAGQDAAQCGTGRNVILRLYSGFPPNAALSSDLGWMNQVYELGLPPNRHYAATSPAMAQTFFGRRGQGTHIMVKQPALSRPGKLERAFYRSILIEELFQSFTFGMDVLLFDQAADFRSKLQERPVRLDRLSWESRDFMRALLRSNPGRLCAFDIFMLHAVAQTDVAQTNEPGFISFIDQEFERLSGLAQATLADPRFAGLVDHECAA